MKTVALSEAKDKLSALVDEAESTHEIITITRHGHNAAVLIAADELESMRETIRLLSTPGTVEELDRAREEYAAGGTTGGDDLRSRFGLTSQ
ncbi:type II toxin-antitoxin system Phd/YefM family antitoxin [Nocardioides rotundus]|uniref:type II toxin-antitoxin system Phd/YefM family antitoxin n=1 Tax=Nocardioides rotundus TaxID=1774216 RepID=UPI001CBE4782|nr:type II toxin-antitoxin system Phd/YefM family antitoxin [Nocardioides rotundus]UAL30239.1 type II toxin-antitoxin system Phd/YefM family antitoxin [Nocardioides rotundus]